MFFCYFRDVAPLKIFWGYLYYPFDFFQPLPSEISFFLEADLHNNENIKILNYVSLT